jgi:8-oxo-dGTP pyrophosphatase MutT (NUDIX family)
MEHVRVMGDPPQLRFDGVDVFLRMKDFAGREIELSVIARAQPLDAQVLRLIDIEWERYAVAQAERGRFGHLTISQLFRLESYSVDQERVRLVLSQTDYREVYGTNITHPEIASVYGNGFMGNALGLCSLVKSSDGYFGIFKRSEEVHELPGYFHFCAGYFERSKETVERIPDIRAAMAMEIAEELGVDVDHGRHIQPIGLCRSLLSYVPELLFMCSVPLDHHALQASQLNFEHSEMDWVPEDELATFVGEHWDMLVPAAKAAAGVFLLDKLGEKSFRRTLPRVLLRADGIADS